MRKRYLHIPSCLEILQSQGGLAEWHQWDTEGRTLGVWETQSKSAPASLPLETWLGGLGAFENEWQAALSFSKVSWHSATEDAVHSWPLPIQEQQLLSELFLSP